MSPAQNNVLKDNRLQRSEKLGIKFFRDEKSQFTFSCTQDVETRWASRFCENEVTFPHLHHTSWSINKRWRTVVRFLEGELNLLFSITFGMAARNIHSQTDTWLWPSENEDLLPTTARKYLIILPSYMSLPLWRAPGIEIWRAVLSSAFGHFLCSIVYILVSNLHADTKRLLRQCATVRITAILDFVYLPDS
jgi:hypothetical protein